MIDHDAAPPKNRPAQRRKATHCPGDHRSGRAAVFCNRGFGPPPRLEAIAEAADVAVGSIYFPLSLAKDDLYSGGHGAGRHHPT